MLSQQVHSRGRFLVRAQQFCALIRCAKPHQRQFDKRAKSSLLRRVRHDFAPLQPRNPFLFISLLGVLAGLQLLVLPRQLLAADLEEIQQRGYLIVGVKDDVRPLGFRGAEGELQGLEIDLARRLADELLGRTDAIVFEPVLNQNRLPALLEGDVDLVIAHMSATSSRARLVSFSTPYFIDGAAIVTSDPAIQQLTDLSGQPVAVLYGSSTIAQLRSLLPSVRLVGVTSYQDAYALLESGEAVAFAADSSVLTGWVQNYPQYRLLPSLLSAEALSVVMPKGNQYDDLRRRVNNAIDRWRQEGWLADRILYWGLPQAGIPYTGILAPEPELQD